MDFSSLSPAQKAQILNGPALTPPDGVVPILENPPNQNAMVVTVTIVFMVLLTIVYLLRTIPKLLITRDFAIEDYLAFAAFCHMVAFAWCIVELAYTTPGWFVHQWNFRLKDTSKFAFIIHVGSTMIAMVIMLMKGAIIIEWIKIFVPGRTRNKFFWCAWGLVGLNTGFYIAGIVSENLSCIPFQMIWDKTITDGHCINTKALDIASASIDFISDLAIIILPQQVIWRLQMSKKKKIGISLLFGMGIFALVASAFRTAATVVYHKSHDATYEVCPVALWAFARLVVLFFIFCIPACPKALRDCHGCWDRLLAFGGPLLSILTHALFFGAFVTDLATVRVTAVVKKSLKSFTSGRSTTDGEFQFSKDTPDKLSNPSREQKRPTKDSILLTNLSANDGPCSESTENLRGHQNGYQYGHRHHDQHEVQVEAGQRFYYGQPPLYGNGFPQANLPEGGILRTDTVQLVSTQQPEQNYGSHYHGQGSSYAHQPGPWTSER